MEQNPDCHTSLKSQTTTAKLRRILTNQNKAFSQSRFLYPTLNLIH